MLELFLEQLVNGLTVGSVYSLVALGYTMVYGVMRLINFAHGELFMLGSYLGFTLLVSTSIGKLGVGWGLIIIVLMVAGAMALLGILIERVAYAPLRKSGRLAPVVSAPRGFYFSAERSHASFGALATEPTPSGRLWTAAGKSAVCTSP